MTDHLHTLRLAFSPNSRYLSCTGLDDVVTIWDLKQQAPLIAKLRIPTSNFSGSVWSPDGTLLACQNNYAISLWDTGTFQQRCILEGSGSSLHSFHLISFSPNGCWLATNECQEHHIGLIWNVSSRTLHKGLRGHEDRLTAAAFDPTSTRIATASDDKTVRIWDVETGEPLFVMEQHRGWVQDVSFSPDGSLILSASSDRTVKIWEASTGVMILSLEGHSNGVMAACFSPCGTYIASASNDKTVRLWRTSDGTCMQTFTEHGGLVWHVTFSPDGKMLSSGANDGSVFIRRMEDIIPTAQSEL